MQLREKLSKFGYYINDDFYYNKFSSQTQMLTVNVMTYDKRYDNRTAPRNGHFSLTRAAAYESMFTAMDLR